MSAKLPDAKMEVEKYKQELNRVVEKTLNDVLRKLMELEARVIKLESK